MKLKPETYESKPPGPTTTVDDHLGVAAWALGVANRHLEAAYKKSRGRRRRCIDITKLSVSINEADVRLLAMITS